MSFCPGFMFGNSGQAWDPLLKSPYLDLLGDTEYLTTGAGGVITWEDRSPHDSHMAQSEEADRPEYNATGWSGSQSTVDFNGGPSLDLGAGATLITALSGSDQPFSMLITLNVNATGDGTICAWDSPSGNAYSIVRFDLVATEGQQLRYDRRDDTGGGAVIRNTSGDLGTGHMRLGVVFTGTEVNLYVNGVLNRNAACDVGTCTFTRFRIGTGPGAVDALDGRIKHMGIAPTIYTGAEMALYHAWSVSNFGA